MRIIDPDKFEAAVSAFLLAAGEVAPWEPDPVQARGIVLRALREYCGGAVEVAGGSDD